jgi:very-short-patch-repair endonuclease
MHAMRAWHPADLTQLASRQYGVVSRAQLSALGRERGWIQRAVAGGRLLRLHRGVYALGHSAPRDETTWLAAVLACGTGAVLSHTSAGALWYGGRWRIPEVTVPHHRRVRGVVTHQGRLTRADRVLRMGIPVTSPARTLADLAHSLDDEALERVVREAQFRGLFSVRAIQDALTRRPSVVLRDLLDDLNPTQSRLEDAFLRLCRRHRIPKPRAQVRDGRRRPDFVWPDARLVVEVDSWQAHSTPHAFQADRTLSNAVQLAGWTILRFTYRDVTRRPELVAAQVRQALGL